MEQTMREVVELVKTASENLWAAGYARAWAIIATDVMWTVFFVIVIGIFGAFAMYARKRYLALHKKREEDWRSVDREQIEMWNNTMWFSLVSTFVMFIVFAVYLNSLLAHILAPEYLAIQELLNLVK